MPQGNPDVYPFWKGLGIVTATILLAAVVTWFLFGVLLYG
jgi:hypothetical protein